MNHREILIVILLIVLLATMIYPFVANDLQGKNERFENELNAGMLGNGAIGMNEAIGMIDDQPDFSGMLAMVEMPGMPGMPTTSPPPFPLMGQMFGNGEPVLFG